MILDDGIATFFRRENAGVDGGKPKWEDEIIMQGMYKRLNFGVLPTKPTDNRINTEISRKIRCWQMLNLNIHDKVLLSENANILFEIANIYHGTDDNGEFISDISLKAVTE